MPIRAVLVLCVSILGVAAPANGASLFVASQGGPEGGSVHRYSLLGDDLGAFGRGFESPSWLAVDRQGNIYVSEYNFGIPIHKLSPDGVELLTIATDFLPAGIAVGDDGSIY